MKNNGNVNVWVVMCVSAAMIVGLFLGNVLAKRSFFQDGVNALTANFLSRDAGNKVDEVLSLINSQYVDTVDTKEITEELMIDLVQKLDPHSVYIPSKDLADVNSELEGSFSGIGVQFNIQNDTTMVVAVISGGPSEKVGLLAGDRIVEVDDSAFVGKEINNEKVMRKLRGPSGTKVKLGVKRHGTSEILHYTITRGAIPIHSVPIAYMPASDIGFIRVDKFATNTYAEFLTAIAELRNQGAKKYIIDLRENSGGLMDQAINMINEFLPSGQMIVYSEGKSYARYEARANGKGSCIDLPVVVLIDDFSASASEIFAGAIQDNDRGLIVGRRSFGKGLVQQQMMLSDGSALRLTVARYYTPSGRSIQKPYEIGKGDEYEMDILNRFNHGEFFSADSIQIKDSVVYKTIGGRTVYGGGGIMPDVFVARDTTQYSPYFNRVTNYGYLYQFAFQYTDKNRKKLEEYRTWQELERYLNSQNLVQEFVAFAKGKGVEPNQKDLDTSRKIMTNNLNAYIIRNILGDKGFYPAYYKNDEVVKRALKEISEM